MNSPIPVGRNAKTSDAMIDTSAAAIWAGFSTTYRDAWQVWLQHGEAFVLLADVSDEEGAQAIVRRLQTADDDASRGARQDNFGERQLPP